MAIRTAVKTKESEGPGCPAGQAWYCPALGNAADEIEVKCRLTS